MSTPVTEAISSRPENEGPIDYGDKLRELFALDEDVVAECRPQLWSIATTAAASLVEPARQNAVGLYAGILDWQLFGKPGDPLPEGLILKFSDDGLFTDGDKTIPYITGSMPGAVGGEFSRLGMKEVYLKYDQEIDKNSSEIRSTVAEFIKQTAEYQLLSSFDRPENKMKEQRLDAYWLRIRQSQVEHAVRLQYGYAQDQPMPAGTQAYQDLSRQLYRLDEETKLQKASPESGQSGLHKARAYLMPFIVQALNDGIPGERLRTINSIHLDEENIGDMVVSYTEADGSEGKEELYEYTDSAGKALSKKVYVGPEEMQFIGSLFTQIAINKLYKTSMRNIEDALSAAIVETAAIVDHDMRASTGYFGYSAELDLLLKTPKHAGAVRHVETDEWRHDTTWDDIFITESNLYTRAEIAGLEQTREGFIIEYGPDDYRVPARLLLRTLGVTTVKVEDMDTKEDLVLLLDNLREQPYVPGYVLVTEDGHGRYGFEIDSNGDQYTPCTIRVDTQQCALLAAEYRSLGLDMLADKVLARTDMTVDELVKLIKNESRYYMPDKLGRWDSEGLPVRSRRIHSLSDFGSYVTEGMLSVQCTGAAAFLKHSLHLVFGPGCAGIVDGLKISNSKHSISHLGHEQTVFSHKGKQYILDATPAADLSGLRDSAMQSSGDDSAQRHAPNAPDFKHLESDDIVIDHQIREEKSKEQKITELTTSFVEQIRVAFAMPNDRKLYDYLARLPRHDPARRTYEIIRQYTLGIIDDEEMRRQNEYVERCGQVAHDVRRKLGIDHYSQPFLEQLRNTTWRLESIAEGR